jgi:hypothetical protein
MQVIGGPLEKDLAEVFWFDVIPPNGIHAVSHILAAESADACPVIIISLCYIPIILSQKVDMGSTKSVSSDNRTLILLSSCNSIVGWGDLRGCRKLVESAVISIAGLEGITDNFQVLSVACEDKSDILHQIHNACAIRGLTVVDCH